MDSSGPDDFESLEVYTPAPPTLWKGRGATGNATNRFEVLKAVPFDEIDPEVETLRPKTEVYVDHSKSILAKNSSPDLGFDYGINPYRGCEHGCAYCYARPTHEYLGFSAGMDFETKLVVKENAAELLRAKFLSKSYVPKHVMMSGVTDCYQPLERKLQLTRQCLEVFSEFRHPVGIVTKNALVARDKDILGELAFWNAVSVTLSITSLDDDLCAKLEPRTSRPRARLRAVEELAKAGVLVGVNIAPLIPALNDREIPAVLKAAKDAGASYASFNMLRLPYSVKDQFADWLQVHFPDRASHVLHLIRDVRGGKLNVSEFGSRMKGQGPFAQQLGQLFKLHAKRVGLSTEWPELSLASFRKPSRQAELF